MEDEILKKVEEAKELAKTNPGKTKKGCKSCKKKKEVELQPTFQAIMTTIELPPTAEEIKEAFLLMQERNVTKEMHTKINAVYKRIFNEDLPFGCKGCGGVHFRRFKHYIEKVLGLSV